MGCGAFVDGGEVLPVVEDVGADLFGCFHGGCAFQKNFIFRNRSLIDRVSPQIQIVSNTGTRKIRPLLDSRFL